MSSDLISPQKSVSNFIMPPCSDGSGCRRYAFRLCVHLYLHLYDPSSGTPRGNFICTIVHLDSSGHNSRMNMLKMQNFIQM